MTHSDRPIASLGAVSIDCSEPSELAAFYGKILGGEVIFENDEFTALRVPGGLLTFQRIEDHRPPQWPTGVNQKQLHLEFGVDDLDAAEAAILAVGGRKADRQPSPQRWRVLLDPAGHPFCVTILLPKTA